MSDLSFLKELRENVVKGKADITRHEMALEMIDDWIKELSAQEGERMHNGRAVKVLCISGAWAMVRRSDMPLKNFDYKCVYCGDDYQVLDHYIPVSKGGGTTFSNCVPSCSKCNSRKHGKMPRKFTDEAIANAVELYLWGGG